ncbi:tetratricopeptide repeat protein [Saccharicrinis sp. FJH54]|uniref:tetratricopeptide repeat protein n=1 Tax=Saccharicrinis sp. FJH54 TaxID=3344665 RepID=UPI0035D45445
MMNKPHNISQKEFEQLERYILNLMDEDERQTMDAGIQSDAVLRDKVNEIRQLMEGIQEAELREIMNQFHQEIEKNRSSGRKRTVFLFSRPFAVAASVIVILALSVYLFMRPDRNQRLFADYYRTDPGLVTAMSSSNADYEFDRGMVDFKTGDYQAAIKRWQPLLDSRPESDTLNYFIGSAYLAVRDAGSAIPKLEKVAEEMHSDFRNDASWYLALAYLLNNQNEKAINILQKTSHPRKDELLRKIGNE